MTKRQTLLLGMLTFVLIGGGWALQSVVSGLSDNRDVAKASPLMVATVPLHADDAYLLHRRFTGQVVAARSSELSFQLAGQIEILHADEGENVKQGQVLAALDTRRLQANRKRLEAELLQAQADLAELTNGSREEDIRAADAEVRQLAAESLLFKNRLERTKKLAERGTSTQDELDVARTNWESIAARLAAAEARRDEIVVGPRTERIDSQRATVSALEASIEELDVQLEDSILTAPYSGTLSARCIDDGAVVSLGQPVFRILEDQALEFHVGLPTSAVSRLERRFALEVVVDGRIVPARVTRRLPVLNSATRTQTLILTLPSAEGIVPGQTGELLVEEQINQPGYWVPNTALQQGIQGLWKCYVAMPAGSEPASHSVEPRDVEVLHVEEDRSFVRGTLSDGDLIVTSGLHRLVAGQLVHVAAQSVKHH